MDYPFFYAWETIEWEIHIDAEDGSPVLDGSRKVIVSLSQGMTLIEKSGEDIGIDIVNDNIYWNLSQEDTSQFIEGMALLQVNVLYDDATRDTTAMAKVEVRRNLHKAVMA